jgi:hypothetical protein
MKNATRPRYEEELAEGRQHNRFKVQNGGFAALRSQFTVLGQIIDISRGGLTFRYVASEARTTRTNGSAELNILMTDGSFCFEKVAFKTIWDSAIPDEFSFGPITLRHCGVKFGELTHSQKVDLEYFIRVYTLGDVRESHSTLPHNESEIASRTLSSCSTGTLHP